jgi:YbbR domain-containing protein
VKISIVENYRVKLVVISLATVFWLTVVTANIYEYDLEVAIAFVNLPPSKTLAGRVPDTARVRFEGEGRALLALLFYDDASIEVDLANVRSPAEVELNTAMVQIRRRGMPVIAKQVLSPRSVRVKLSNVRSKVIPVKPEVEISTQPGYTIVGELQVVPESVRVAGPEEFLKEIDAVKTQPRQYANVRAGLHDEIGIEPFPDSMHVSTSADRIKISADVQKLIELTIKEIPVQVRNAPPGLTVTPVPSTLAITVEGGEKLLMSLKREDIVAYIDFGRAQNPNAGGHAAYIQVPAGVRYRNVKPAFFKLMMERANGAPARD